MAQLIYADVSAITYRATDIILRLTPEQQSLVIQAVAIYNDNREWEDYETYGDDIDALVAASEYALQIEDTSQVSFPAIDLFTINATPLAGAGTLTYNSNTGLPFGYTMSNASTTLFGMEQPIWLAAGDYDYHGWSTFTTNGGNTDVAITDGSSVIDTIVTGVNQSGTFGVRIHSTGSFTIPDDGFYKVVAANNGTGAGAGRQANWISHHIRQTS